MTPFLIASLAGVLSGSTPTQHIVGGQEAETCAWPTVGSLAFGVITGTSCAAAVIHPQIALTYFECLGGFIEPLELGDDVVEGPVQELPMISNLDYEACTVIESASIYACVLAEPALDLPRTPPLAGCETGILEPGREVALVGFGANVAADHSGDGPKRWSMGTITAVGEAQFLVERAEGASTCGSLDLGAPVYVQMPDGSWRIAGMVTTVIDCEGPVTVKRIDRYLPVIENLADVTPCHDEDGAWAPTEECGAFSLAGPEGTGTWDDLCADTPRSGPSTTCGAAFGSDESPEVRITTPESGIVLAPDTAIAVQVVVNHPVVEVELAVDGQPAGADEAWPYGFASVTFPEGTWTLTAIAHGEDGTTRVSEEVVVHVGDPDDGRGDTTGGDTTGIDADDSSTADATTGGSSTGDVVVDPTTGGTEDGAPALDGGSSGCACTLHERRDGAAFVWLVLSVVLARTRRARNATTTRGGGQPSGAGAGSVASAAGASPSTHSSPPT